MAEKKFGAQVNYGWGLSLNMTGKAPAVAKRIFDTYADALAYANDVNDSAIEGLVLSVVADDADKNGVYFVQQVAVAAVEADEEKGIEAADAIPAVLVKLGSADAAAGDTADALQTAKDYTDQEVKKLADGAVSANTKAIAVLNGSAETEGSVAKAVADEKALREAAEKDITDRLDVIEGEAEGSIKKALADAKSYTDTKVDELDATVTGASAHVSVEIVEENGKLTAVTVAETDIASASGLTKNISDETERAEAAESALASRLAVIEGEAEGSIKKALADAKAYADEKVSGLDATVGSQTVAEGKHVAVEVVEVDGKLTAVTVVEKDIASADALTAEVSAREAADTAINNKIGSVAEGKTVVKMIEDAQATAEAAATKLTEKTEGHVTVSGVKDETTGAWTYTIAENDIASASGVSATISAETAAREAAIAALDATVTGEGTYVDVTVSQVDGVITSVTIAENDIASAAVLADVKKDVDNFFKDAEFSDAAKDTLKELQAYITSDADGALKMEQAIADNKKAIEDEVTRAKAAEEKLGKDLAAEVATRAEEDGKLDAAIKKEVSDREAAVTALTQTVTNLSNTVAENETDIEQKLSDLTAVVNANETDIEGKVSNLTQTVTDNKSAIEKTVADNKAALDAKDGELTQAIEAEATTARAAEQANTAAIEAEAAKAREEEGKLSGAIAAEATARAEAMTAETAIRVAAEAKVLEDAKADTEAKVKAEKERAEAAEKKLGEDLATEAARADAAEKVNAAAVVAEKERAEAAEKKLGERVTALGNVTITADENSNIKVTKGEDGNIKISFEWLTF